MQGAPAVPAERLEGCLAEHPRPGADARELGHRLAALVAEGLDRLPAPGAGATLARWQALARVAARDLGLCKLYEGHTDALAILHELGADAPPAGSTWGVWAAEPPQARVRINARTSQQDVRLDGTKAWCSGAAVLSHALLTGWNEEGRQQLVAVALVQPGVRVGEGGWNAVGMAATGSVAVHFEQARAHCIGAAAGYLERPGFWHGGAGIAACWFGAAQALGEALRTHGREHDEPHALAHLGALDAHLHGAACALRECAAWIDRHPRADAEGQVRRLRALCESAAEAALLHVGHALGAAPYCLDPYLARLLADLPVYLRQSHAERDLAVLGRLAALAPPGSWMP
ncbi:acyl-CoA dehydrogenase [Pseudomonas sp. zfem005]|uniref:acyl-CoA dehydrogenase n=1 Tax=Pseudomonas sp. zfem005 TaxID=3078200 RepID=UPI002927C612|nr:acyl-CoA dehydrogenase [Pseudomonas sp. zfem005]MDU9412616.1 acyl-CoA dehydrogenase [Pseudomonas sp. zfem005]